MSDRDSEGGRAGWRKLLRRVARAVERPELAEDFIHAAYIRLEEYRRKTHVEHPNAFLVRTAINIGVDERRRERVRSEVNENVHELIDLRDNRPLQTEVLIAQERLRRVEEGLLRLSPRTRTIFLMHRIDGLTYREIAERLGITVSAVEKHIAKAALFLTEWAEGW